MKKVFQKIVIAGFVAVLALPVAACNTIEGIGRDAKAAGDAITGAAQQTKGY